jgi:hypothetical protein
MRSELNKVALICPAKYHNILSSRSLTRIVGWPWTVRKYAEGKFNVVYDSPGGTSFFMENIILPRGQPVADITQAVIESAK